ncbi:hypothetical protein CDG79_20785 [Nostoc sp. 'Peltigera membranacea cyanobiont' 232]|nr:hypothetical protein CDG79_20785 [Nostoc sp. 'Peltigera membranacea cyanobiont' 232]
MRCRSAGEYCAKGSVGWLLVGIGLAVGVGGTSTTLLRRLFSPHQINPTLPTTAATTRKVFVGVHQLVD